MSRVKTEEPAKTIQECTKALSLDPNTYSALIARATAYLEMDLAEEALQDCERALTINNKEIDAHLKRFAALLKLDRPSEMLKAADDLLAVTPGDFIGYFHRGIALNRLGRDEETAAAFTCAIECRPGAFGAYVNRGATYTALGHFDKALADCEKALKLQPTNVSAMVNKALVLRSTGYPEEAIKLCSMSIAADPESALSYCNRAYAKFIMNKMNEALMDADFSIKLAKQPMYVAKCKCIKAKFLVDAADGGGGGGGRTGGGDGGGGSDGHGGTGGFGRRDQSGRSNGADDGQREAWIREARALCDSAICMAPENTHPWRYTWSTSALVAGMMGDHDGAVRNVQLVLDRSPGFIYGINIKARLLMMQDRCDEALAAVNSALALNSRDPESNYIRYQIRAKTGNPAAAQDLNSARNLGYLRGE